MKFAFFVTVTVDSPPLPNLTVATRDGTEHPEAAKAGFKEESGLQKRWFTGSILVELPDDANVIAGLETRTLI